MLAAFLPLVLVSLAPGDVRTIPAGSVVVKPGKLNWHVKDPLIPMPEAARGMVLRVNPEKVEGVVEVKILDGTSRDQVGWLAPTSPIVTTTQPPAVYATPAGIVAVKPSDTPAPKRRYARQDHDALTEMTMSMAAGLSSEYARQASMSTPVAPWMRTPGAANSSGLYGLGNVGFGGGSHLCGAMTRTTGAPCRNPVSGPGFCWQHR